MTNGFLPAVLGTWMSIFNDICLPLVVGVAYTMLLVLVSDVLPHWICGPVGLITTLVLTLVFATVLATGMLRPPPAGAPAGAPGDCGQADSFGADEDADLVDEQAASARPPTTQAASTASTFLRRPDSWLTMTVLSLRWALTGGQTSG